MKPKKFALSIKFGNLHIVSSNDTGFRGKTRFPDFPIPPYLCNMPLLHNRVNNEELKHPMITETDPHLALCELRPIFHKLAI